MLCSVCLCFGDPEKAINIFNEIGMNLNIAEIIEQHMWIRPQPSDDSLSNQSYICHQCWKALSEFHEFYEQAKMAHDNHKVQKEPVIIKEEIFDSGIDIKLETEQEQHAEQYKAQDNHQFHMETFIIKEEVLDSAISINLEREEQFKVNINDVSKATNEIYKNEDKSAKCSEYGKQSEELNGENDSILEQSFELLEPMEQMNPLDIEDESENEIVSDEYEPPKTSDRNHCNWEAKKIKLTSVKRKRKSSSERSESSHMPKKKNDVYQEMIQKHISMACSLCMFVGKTFSEIRKHFASCHPNVKPYISCCDRKLTKPCYVAQHALTHENPNCFNCLECNKSFTTSRGLHLHNLKHHAPEEDKIYNCNLCPKKFARSHLLKFHKTSHIPKDEWQIFCTECEPQKPFASEYLLSRHKFEHRKEDKKVCHVCGKVFRYKYSFEKHVRLHFEVDPRVPCPYPDCETWLKDELNLKLHMKHHNPEGITYKCTECDKICINSRSLRNHKRYMHSNKTFPCELCDKTFKKAITLREHMAQHTGETLYNCPFCTRTFNSNANMHAHKKHQHPMEWEEWRKNKKGSSQALITNLNPLGT